MTTMTEQDYRDAEAGAKIFDENLKQLRKVAEYDQIAERVFRKILWKIVAPMLVGWWVMKYVI